MEDKNLKYLANKLEDDFNSVISKLRDKIDDLEIENEDLQKKVGVYEEDITKLQDEVKDLREELDGIIREF